MATLSSVPIHAAASSAGLQTLADLVPQDGLQEWAASCRDAMQSLAAKVGVLQSPPKTWLLMSGMQDSACGPCRTAAHADFVRCC